MWNVDVTLIYDWLLGLDTVSYNQVVAALQLLEERGPPSRQTARGPYRDIEAPQCLLGRVVRELFNFWVAEVQSTRKCVAVHLYPSSSVPNRVQLVWSYAVKRNVAASGDTSVEPGIHRSSPPRRLLKQGCVI